MNQGLLPETVVVWLVEDHGRFRKALVELLDREPGVKCALAASTGEELLDALGRDPLPNVVLMDLGLPGMSGVDGIRRLRTQAPTVRTIVLSVHDEDDRVFDALRAGAIGYLLKSATGAEIVSAIRAAMDGGSPMNPAIARKVLDGFVQGPPINQEYGLTAREREVLQCVVDALSQKQIADKLGLSAHTVDTHLRNIYAKLQVRSRGGAVAKALRERLI